MKAFALALAAGVAGSAVADIDRSDYVIYGADALSAASMDSAGDFNPIAGAAGPIYSNMSADIEGFFSLPGGAPDADGVPQVLNFDDYTSSVIGSNNMTEFKFVGGVDTIGGVVFFDFFDAGAAFTGGFGVALPQAGNFIWTITIGSIVEVADAGFAQMAFDDDGAFGPATGATWFLTADDATIGNNGASAGFTSPGGLDLNHAFEISVPAPASAALLGLGGLVAARRRR